MTIDHEMNVFLNKIIVSIIKTNEIFGLFTIALKDFSIDIIK